MPDTAMWAWVRSLHIPWIDSTATPNRRAMAKAFADVMQHVVDDTGAALRELWPSTCSEAMLVVWGEVLERPRRPGETVDDWRVRLATWRAERVGTSGWVLDEVQRITGDDPPRVIELPRQSGRWGYGTWGGDSRWGVGPVVVVGVEPAVRADLQATLEPGVPPHVGVVYLEPAVFDAILAGPEVAQPPVASAGATQWVAWGATVTLDGSGSSDPDGSIASYAWEQVSGGTVTLTDDDMAMPSFTAPNLDDTLVFRLTVTDDEGATGSDTVTIQVGLRAQFTPPMGRTTVFLGSFVKGSNASDGDALWRDPRNTSFGESDLTIGSLRDGSLDVVGGDTEITRIALRTSRDQLGMNDHPDADSLATAFGASAQIHIRIDSSTLITEDTVDSTGGDWYYWELPDADQTTIGNIPDGRSFVVAVTRPNP